jgi:Transposase domain (DUF772)
MLRILLIGYVYGIRSEHQLCSEVHLNLAYRWFCRLGLDGVVPDHSTFSKNRYGRFRESDIYRVLFEDVVGQCCSAGLIGGSGFAVDGSLIGGDAFLQGVGSGRNVVTLAKRSPDEISRYVHELTCVLRIELEGETCRLATCPSPSRDRA